MKTSSLIAICGFLLCACVSANAYAGLVDFAPAIERLELDFAVPSRLHKQDFTSTSKFAENLTLNVGARVDMLKTKIGKFGLEGSPTWDIRNANINGNVGMYIKPFDIKWLQVHYDHAINESVTHLRGIRWKGNNVVGIRLIIKE